MRKMYWRPRRVSRTALVLISLAAVSGYVALSRFPTRVREPYHQQKIAAAQLAQACFKTIREERLKKRLPNDPESDPAQTGLIGSLVTPVTTNAGSLPSKQTSVNPNYAAVVVQFLNDAGLVPGDVVAVGYSGSFPAFNIAVLSAIEVMKLKPIIIASASSSQWGANEPELLWIRMERILKEKGLLSSSAVAASIGGIEDRGLGLTKRGRRLLRQEIEKLEIQLIDPEDFQDSVEQRVRLYRQHAGPSPIRAYVNVGGGTISVGRHAGKKLFHPGVNRKPPISSFPIDSIMGRFLQDGVTVIHMIQAKQLAELYGFPESPIVTPQVGDGKIFFRERTNKTFALGLLVTILGALYLFVRSDLGFRMTRGGTRQSGESHPEPMV